MIGRLGMPWRAGWLAGMAVLLLWPLAPAAEEFSDPLEPLNRGIYEFNEDVDEVLLKPAARAYKRAVPKPARVGVNNFFDNLHYPIVAANSLLQGKVEQGLSDILRFAVNSTWGLFGLIDVATPMGMPRHQEDFGQTLATWGVPDGWYLVLPLVGPSTLRDATGLAVDTQADPLFHYDEVAVRNQLLVLDVVETRAQLLGASNLLEQAALDPYAFTRESYRQRRQYLIHDGNPPLEAWDDDDYDDYDDDDGYEGE